MLGLNWLDITIICILLIGIFDGMYKGFIISFFNIAGIFLSLFVSRFLMGASANFLINNTSIYDSLKKTFDKRMASMDNLSVSILKLFNYKGNHITDSITMVFIDIACFIIIFFVSTVIINILKNILKTRVKKSPLRHVDKLLGGLIGLAVASLFVFLIFAVIIPFTTVMAKSNTIVSAVDSSRLAKYFFYFNFIIPWLQKANHTNAIFTFIHGIMGLRLS